MANDRKGGGKMGGKVGKAALLLGAAGLLLFIVGVKRKYRLDEQREIDLDRAARAGAESDDDGRDEGDELDDEDELDEDDFDDDDFDDEHEDELEDEE
jgi:hypothetical protein